jgi:DNA-binding CsgD family transcriptional regulator
VRENQPGPQVRFDGLTKREHEVLRLVGNGLSNDEIAASLAISPVTARTHVSRILRWLGCRDRAQLVTLASQIGAVTRSTGRTNSTPRNDAGRTLTGGSGGNINDVAPEKGADVSRKGDVHGVPRDKGLERRG